MATPQILRIPRTDDTGFILCEVKSTGKQPLDLRLVATEGDAIYTVKLRHDRIGSLRDSKSACSEDEWKSILESILQDGEPIEAVEAAATVHSAGSMDIAVRRRVVGITQRLGTLALHASDEVQVELFDWCGLLALERSKTKQDLAAATARNQELESQNARLKDQLEELVRAKEKNESDLLKGFRDLLNEKKLHVRKLQRLLGSAKIDPARAAAAPATTAAAATAPATAPPAARSPPRGESSSSRKPGPLKRAKRKAARAKVSDDDSEDGFKDIKTVNEHQASGDESVDQRTPDEETDSEPEVEDDDKSMPDARLDSSQQGSAPSRDKGGPAAHTRGSQKAATTPRMPPKRALPFGQREPAPAAQADAGGSETSSGDEEL